MLNKVRIAGGGWMHNGRSLRIQLFIFIFKNRLFSFSLALVHKVNLCCVQSFRISVLRNITVISSRCPDETRSSSSNVVPLLPPPTDYHLSFFFLSTFHPILMNHEKNSNLNRSDHWPTQLRLEIKWPQVFLATLCVDYFSGNLYSTHHHLLHHLQSQIVTHLQDGLILGSL